MKYRNANIWVMSLLFFMPGVFFCTANCFASVLQCWNMFVFGHFHLKKKLKKKSKQFWYVRKLKRTIKLTRAGALRQTIFLIWPKIEIAIKCQTNENKKGDNGWIWIPTRQNPLKTWLHKHCFIHIAHLWHLTSNTVYIIISIQISHKMNCTYRTSSYCIIVNEGWVRGV